MKTVLIFSWFYLPYLGGAELFVEAITRRLSRRFRFFIVTSRGLPSLPAREGRAEGTVFRAGLGARVDKFLYPLPALRAALAIPQVDLVHAVMVNAAALAAYFYLRLRRRPSLLTLQSGDSEQYVRDWLGPLFPLYPRLHRPFDRIHSISSYLRDRAIRFGARPETITVVPNGVDVETFHRSRFNQRELADLRFRLDLQGKEVIVSVSRLALKNGLDTLVRAMARVGERHPNAVLVLVGDGEDRRRLQELARGIGVSDRVRFVGGVEHRETARFLAVADVFARPSVSEGLGTALLEAMACQVPVVASPVGGIVDFLKDGENGLFCQPGRPESVASSILRLLDDRGLARQLGEAGRSLAVSRYGWDAVAERIGALYDELLQ